MTMFIQPLKIHQITSPVQTKKILQLWQSFATVAAKRRNTWIHMVNAPHKSAKTWW